MLRGKETGPRGAACSNCSLTEAASQRREAGAVLLFLGQLYTEHLNGGFHQAGWHQRALAPGIPYLENVTPCWLALVGGRCFTSGTGQTNKSKWRRNPCREKALPFTAPSTCWQVRPECQSSPFTLVARGTLRGLCSTCVKSSELLGLCWVLASWWQVRRVAGAHRSQPCGKPCSTLSVRTCGHLRARGHVFCGKHACLVHGLFCSGLWLSSAQSPSSLGRCLL